jgi:hypothetical protein
LGGGFVAVTGGTVQRPLPSSPRCHRESANASSLATAHGAALMLLPFLMGLCEAPVATAGNSTGAFGHDSVMTLMRLNVGTAVFVSLVHSAAMMISELAAAWVVYRYVGLHMLRAAWLNLDVVWALCLIMSGGVADGMGLLSSSAASV